MIRASKLAFRLAASLLALVAVALAVLGARLLSGPISLPWLTPYVETAVVSEAIPRVEIGDVQLRLGERGGIELAAVGIRGKDRAGQVLFEVPEIEVTPDLKALAVDRVMALSRVALEAPEIIITRRSDGSIGLGGIGGQAAEATQQDQEQIDAESLLNVLLTADTPGSPGAYLRQIRVSGGVLRLEDRGVQQTVEAHSAELLIQREEHGLSVRLGFTLEQEGSAARIEGTALYDTRRVTFEVELANLDLGELAALAGAPSLRGISLAADARLSGVYRLDGDLSPITFELSAAAGTIDLPELLARTLPIDSAGIRGEIASDLKTVRVLNLDLRTGETHLTAEAEVDWHADDLALTAQVVAENVLARDLEAYWPPAAEPMARQWVTQNITEGVVPRAEARFRFEPGDLDQKPVPEHTIEGSFGFENLTVAYFAPMPPIRGIDGKASFTARRMDFDVTSGHVDDLVIEDGSVTITGMGLPGRDTTQLEIRAAIDGPIDQAIALIDHEPLGLASPLGLDPAGTAGHARTDLAIGMPLHKDFDAQDIRVTADATLVDARWTGIRTGIDLDQGQLQLRVDREHVELGGKARINGVPLQLEALENLMDDAPFDRRIRLEGEVSVADLARIGLDPPVPLEGAVDVQAGITERNGITEVELQLGLTPLGIDVAAWQKPAGQPGALDASVLVEGDGTTTIESFDLDTATLLASGSLRLRSDPLALDELRLTRVRFDGSDATVTMHRDTRGRYIADVEADTLNLDALLAGGNATDGNSSGAEVSEPAPFELTLRAGSLTFEDRDLRDVAAVLVREHTGWHSASISGQLPAGGKVDLRLEPEGEAHRLQVSSDDAGAMFAFVDPDAKVRGGNAKVKATIHRQRPTLLAEGVFRAEEFTLVEAPLLARLLTVASLTGIRNLLGGEGIYFDRLKVPFTLDDRTLTIADGKMSGSQVGLTLDGEVDLATGELSLTGTVVPLYTLNRALGSIPVVGDFLAGTKGEGAFAATYRVTGSTEAPEITVNPLTVLAPGLLRELFAGLRDGTLEPPEEPRSGGD